MGETRYTILIVDDNPDLLELLQDGLSEHFTILLAHDGIEGLTYAMEARPDCAIIDVKMPGLDGFQLVRALRGDPETQEMPLIILTAMPEEQGQWRGFASGTDRYLTKPVLPSELIQAIQASLATGRTDRAARLRRLAEEGDR
jgi:DNA-binding response OmpR family regulator